MDNSFTYLPSPQANWSWNMYWIFHTYRPRLFSVARVLFKNSREKPAASILPWKIERPFRIRERKCSVPKMHVVTLVLLSILLFRAFQHIHGYNILGICPSASYSHQQPFQALMKALAARGHRITVASTIPLKVYKSLFSFFFCYALFGIYFIYIYKRNW